MLRTTLVSFSMLLLIGGCGSSSSNTGSKETPTNTSCAWPAGYDSADGSVGQCVASRAYVSCKTAAGGGVSCASAGALECNSSDNIPLTDCQDLCRPDEYAVTCGAPGPFALDNRLPGPADHVPHAPSQSRRRGDRLLSVRCALSVK